MANHASVSIAVWSDYVCPFCYLEAPVLERLSEAYGEALDLQWRAFELRPAPVPTLDPDGEYLHTIWYRIVYPMARQTGMTLKLPPVQPRSRKALEMAEFARERARFQQVHSALFKAFFEDGHDLASIDVLVGIGTAAGLNGEQLRAALKQDTYRDRVIDDELQARNLGVTAVPTMLIGRSDKPLAGAQALSGAQPYEVIRAAVESALRCA
jgi:predicted DsbA family dithiol-disulfide isomerase